MDVLARPLAFTWLFLTSNRSTVTALVLQGGVDAVFTWYPGLSDISTALGTVHHYAPVTIGSRMIVRLQLVLSGDRLFTNGDCDFTCSPDQAKGQGQMDPRSDATG